jgi:Flp pilus assembly protein TadD
MRIRKILAVVVFSPGLLLFFSPPSSAAQKTGTNRDTNLPRSPIVLTIVVRDSAGASAGLTPTVQLSGEAQDGTVYSGSPTNKGDQWRFVVPGPGTYTAQVSAPGYKTAQCIVSVSNQTDNPQFDVTLYPDSSAEKVVGSSILTPKVRKELDQGKNAMAEKRFDDANSHLQKALRLAPTSSEVNYYSGLLDYYTGNFQASRDLLQTSVSLDPENGPAFLALGELYYRLKDYPDAVKVLEQALTLEPQSWRAEAVLGSSYFRQDDYEKAREHAQKALVLGKDEASGVDFLLGKCQVALGKKAEAILAFKAFLALQPPSDLTRSAEQILAQLQEPPN